VKVLYSSHTWEAKVLGMEDSQVLRLYSKFYVEWIPSMEEDQLGRIVPIIVHGVMRRWARKPKAIRAKANWIMDPAPIVVSVEPRPSCAAQERVMNILAALQAGTYRPEDFES
jgi:hypothetical protein